QRLVSVHGLWIGSDEGSRRAMSELRRSVSLAVSEKHRERKKEESAHQGRQDQNQMSELREGREVVT
ncbi:hypothetical protein RH858_15730, partial [Halalkaliarchaeum sp. AArc-GB]|uniref:hypothetical protein n=1 Tax=Halalkaliarchaeum sp. AArc-GB TaxID=3074078 RepID=UPI00285B4776